MFTKQRIQKKEEQSEKREIQRSNNKQAILKNGIQYYDDIGSAFTFLQSKNEDFLPRFMEKIIHKSREFNKNHEELAIANLISKVVKKPETFVKVQNDLLQWIETMLEWGYSLLENDPRDQTYEKVQHHHLDTENYQHAWSVAMLAFIRLISCRESHFELGPKTICTFEVRRSIALISNLFLLEDDSIYKKLLNFSENEEGLTPFPITPDTFTKSLPLMQIFGLKLGCAMMLTFRDNLLPYAGILRDLSEQLLKTFHIQLANESIEISTFQRYRESLRFVEVFVEVFGNYSFDSISRTILPILSKNLIPFEKALMLWNTNYLEDKKKLLESNASKNKRKKKKDQEELNAVLKESPLQTPCPEAYVLLRSTYITVATISSIFFYCKQQINHHNEEEAYESLADIMTRTIHILTQWDEQVNLSSNVLHLHVDALERTSSVILEFYKLLQNLILCISASDAISPFLNQSLHIFRSGRKQHINGEIRTVCHGALIVLDAFIHPRSKPLFIPHAESIEILYQSLRENVKRKEVSGIIEKFDNENVIRSKYVKNIDLDTNKHTEVIDSIDLNNGDNMYFGNNTPSKKRKEIEEPTEHENKRQRIEEPNRNEFTENINHSNTPNPNKIEQISNLETEVFKNTESKTKSTESTINEEKYIKHKLSNEEQDGESIDVDMGSASDEDEISDLDI